MDTNSKTPVLLTVNEVADILRVHYRTAYRLVIGGKIKAIKIGTQWRIPEKALMEFIEEGWKEAVPSKRTKTAPGPQQLKLPFDKE
ncbi:helix-turn-helix domain-containing protein [Salidesulfovibrio brasiliensis]|uniref:helix-turn-helix domain-containing protein n=1 Tax=Salidesulfovibrio brasiliensis TaxID=221711 RepID=UPI0006D078B3|nr:helix-turn-helix domain-containing protein [Salidesulfovibrio brasiliensis]